MIYLIKGFLTSQQINGHIRKACDSEMKVINFGSLNLDYVYTVDHIVTAGETISSAKLQINCGGKGLNQSIALAKAGVYVYHAGKVGHDGDILTSMLNTYGVNTDNVLISETRTGNAIIQVDKNGQNSIVLYGGANRDIDPCMIDSVIAGCNPGDILLLQNEINNLDIIMEQAHKAGLTIILNPSPADSYIKQLPLEYVSIFILNEIEGREISGFINPDDILTGIHNKYPNSRVLLTLGEKGSCYLDADKTYRQGIIKSEVVDTTAAGDTYTGYFIAGLINGLSPEQNLRQASMAASIAVSRPGAAASIPYMKEVLDMLNNISDN